MIPGLKQRLLTALYIGLVLIPMILISNVTCYIVLSCIMLGMLYEYFKMVYAERSAAFTYLFTGMLLSIAVFYIYLRYWHSADQVHWISLSVLCLLGLANIISLLWKKRSLISRGIFRIQALYYITIPVIMLILFIYHLPEFRWILFSIFVLIWISDSAAFFFGSRFGKKKLFPLVSPNKTFAGFWGAGGTVLIAAILISSLTHLQSLLFWIIAALAVWVLGTLGDLMESSLKRRFQTKDSGTFLPGHGGFLDRFDSFIFVIPFIMLILKLTT